MEYVVVVKQLWFTIDLNKKKKKKKKRKVKVKNITYLIRLRMRRQPHIRYTDHDIAPKRSNKSGCKG